MSVKRRETRIEGPSFFVLGFPQTADFGAVGPFPHCTSVCRKREREEERERFVVDILEQK